jgi:hypothetical protein
MIPAVLAGLGALGGGVGGFKLAGRYLQHLPPELTKAGKKGTQKMSDALLRGAIGLDRYEGPGAIGTMAGDLQNVLLKGAETAANIPVEKIANRATTVGQVGLGVLGGLGAGTGLYNIGNALMPQEQAVDPESYGSSNSPGARYKAPTMQYM